MIRQILLVLVALAIPLTAHAVVVERVVAVVGERSILLTDLRKRARPFLVRLYTQVPAGPQRAAAESKMYAQLLERMVDELLEATAALKTNTGVTSIEIDQTLARIAGSAGTTVARLHDEVRRSTGMTEQEYRQEIRRQVLEGKLLNRLVQTQVVGREHELRAMFDRVVAEELRVRLYNPAWIVFRLGKSPSPEQLKARMSEARKAVARARAGEAFAVLAAELSEDPQTKDIGGDLGVRAPSGSPAAMTGQKPAIAPELEQAAMKLQPDEIGEPFRFKDALVVMTLISRQPSRHTSFEPVRGEMIQRVRAAKLEKAKKKWLTDLRRRTHVDVRL